MDINTHFLIFAILATIPSPGTDANGSLLTNCSHNVESTTSRPILNKRYQMLYHSSIKLNNSDNLENNSVNVKVLNNDNKNFDTINIKFKTNKTKNIEKRSSSSIILSNITTKVEVNFHIEDSATKVIIPTALALERKKKPGEAGSNAPLLNYIFDAYSTTHQHRNEKVSNNNGIYAAMSPELEALVGSTAYLDCKVNALHDKLVSWVRKKNELEPMELLTTGTQQYTADNRYSARFIPPDIWRLEIRNVKPSDAANYDCQLSAHPPRTARVTLHVPAISVRIVDGAGADVSEQVCEVGSTVALRCEVNGLKMEGGPSLLWYRREVLLNDDTTRGGISVRTEFSAHGASSVLRVARVRGADAGQYTCAVARSPLAPTAHVILHVIKGESLAELHQGGAGASIRNHTVFMYLCLLVNLLQ